MKKSDESDENDFHSTEFILVLRVWTMLYF